MILANKSFSAQKVALLGLLLGMILILLVLERMLPPLPFLPPNFKLGLSNIIVMYTIFFVGTKEAFTMVLLKGFFNLLLRGTMGAVLSLSGGFLSVLAIVLVSKVFRGKVSFLILSILGALMHNIGQLLAAAFMLGNDLLFISFLPIVLIAGVVLGTLTGLASQVIVPIFNQINRQKR